MPTAVLLHTVIQWLYQRKALVQLFELRVEFTIFFSWKPFLLEKMTDKLWLFTLEHLADAFLKMNKVNPSL